MTEDIIQDNDKRFSEYEKLVQDAKNTLKYHETKKKEIIENLGKKLDDSGYQKDLICEKVCEDLNGYAEKNYIRKCLPDEYKQKEKVREQSTSQLRSMSANDDKKILEVSSTGEEAFSNTEEIFSNAIPTIEAEPKRIEIPNQELLQELQNKDDMLSQKDKTIQDLKSKLESKTQTKSKSDFTGRVILDQSSYQKIRLTLEKRLSQIQFYDTEFDVENGKIVGVV